MLVHLHIEQLALIELLELDFRAGLIILSGETGAGKSIVFDALTLILGARADREMIRTGAEKLVVEAQFLLPPESPVRARLDELGVDGGAELLLRREVTPAASRCRVNGVLVPTATLARIGEVLVDFHGQHDHQSLLQIAFHRECLDVFGRLEPQRAQVGIAYSEWKLLGAEIARLEARSRERERLLDMLRFQVGEIDQAEVAPGEDDRLHEECQMLSHAETLRRLLGQVVDDLMMADDSVLGRLAAARSALDQAARYLDPARKQSELLEAARLEVESVAETAESLLQGLEANPQRLEEALERLETLKKLKRKYGPSLEDVLEFADKSRADLRELETAEERMGDLSASLVKAERKLLELSRNLSERRKAVAREFERRVSAELRDLAMKRAVLAVSFHDPEPGAERFSAHGIDHPEFLFAPNTGTPPKPLRKIASGGEMSRVMLALKSILAGADTIPILVFDEIDSGIGGETAHAVGRKLAELAAHHQVLCVTHLAQIARFASQHFQVSKSERGGMTVSQVLALEGEERVAELARLLSGQVTEQALAHARELLVTGEKGTD